jgi:hypothetical protein
VSAAVGEPSAVHVIVMSSDNDGSIPTLLVYIKGESSICALSTVPKMKKKLDFGRYS